MTTIKFKKLHGDAHLPENEEGNIGWDIRCVEDEGFRNGFGDGYVKFKLYPGDRHTFSTGLASEIPKGYAILFRDRSGLAAKHGIHGLAGVIDESYRGEWKVCLINLSNQPYAFTVGDKITQGILVPVVNAQVEWSEELSETIRGAGGFGSTGK